MEEAIPILSPMPDRQKQNITDIINTYSKRLLGFISKRVSRPSDAEDILQDVFYQLAGSLTPIEQVSSWLFTVARNKITDQQRKKKPELFADLAVDSELDDDELSLGALLLDDSDNPETDYLRALFWEELYTALNELPAEQKEVFLLHEMEGLSFKQIAEKTNENINTLLSRKRYAVLYLRQRLKVLHDELLDY